MKKKPKLIIFVILLAIAVVAALAVFMFSKREPSSDPLACKSDADCTYYNATTCCGYKPVNKLHRKYKKDIPVTCLMYCGEPVAKCQNRQCVVELKNLPSPP